MLMGKMYPEVDTCISLLSVMQRLFTITTKDLAIESLNAENQMEVDTTTMLYRKVDIEHLEDRDMHGTKGEITLQ